jgi:hypothetical protein
LHLDPSYLCLPVAKITGANPWYLVDRWFIELAEGRGESNYRSFNSLRKRILAAHWRLTLVILATGEAEMGRI